MMIIVVLSSFLVVHMCVARPPLQDDTFTPRGDPQILPYPWEVHKWFIFLMGAPLLMIGENMECITKLQNAGLLDEYIIRYQQSKLNGSTAPWVHDIFPWITCPSP